VKLAAILFDKDGTFADFSATWGPAIDSVMRSLAKGDEAAYQRLATFNRFEPSTGRLYPDSPFIAQASADFAAGWARALGVSFDTDFHRMMDRLLDAAALAHVTPIGDPGAVFDRLRGRGLRLGVITNDTEAGARAQCDRLELTARLDAIIGYDSGFGRKPGPGQILAFAERFGLVPSRMAMVGDTTHDLAAARAAGCLAIGVLSGFASREELAPHADLVLDGIEALPAWLNNADLP